MAAAFQNSVSVLSIGIFFSLIIIGLSSNLPATMLHGLTGHGSPPPTQRGSLTCPRWAR